MLFQSWLARITACPANQTICLRAWGRRVWVSRDAEGGGGRRSGRGGGGRKNVQQEGTVRRASELCTNGRPGLEQTLKR